VSTVQASVDQDSNGRFVTRFLTSNKFGSPFSFHPGGFSVAFVDGSTKSMSADIDFDVLKKLVFIKDTEIQ
jgi:prepilin-type processing-associated H-X9-DG protein